MNAAYERHDQYGVKVNPIAAAKIMDDMLLEAGVTIYYAQPIVDVLADNHHIQAIHIATKDEMMSCAPAVAPREGRRIRGISQMIQSRLLAAEISIDALKEKLSAQGAIVPGKCDGMPFTLHHLT